MVGPKIHLFFLFITAECQVVAQHDPCACLLMSWALDINTLKQPDLMLYSSFTSISPQGFSGSSYLVTSVVGHTHTSVLSIVLHFSETHAHKDKYVCLCVGQWATCANRRFTFELDYTLTVLFPDLQSVIWNNSASAICWRSCLDVCLNMERLQCVSVVFRLHTYGVEMILCVSAFSSSC